MSQVKDPKIKLFGKTIGLPETVEAAGIRDPAAESCVADTENSVNPKRAGSVLEEGDFNGDAVEQESQGRQPDPGHDNPKQENQAHPSPSNETNDSTASTQLAHDTKQNPTEPDNSNERTLKKPEKLLPCPRCSSTDTKFCYFNNYNVNQPRHFCKNCHRYWTAGGAMRNVPVGAGRRKNKNQPAPQFRSVPVPEAARGNSQQTSFLVFGSDTHAPLGESVVSVLNIGNETNGRKENSGYERLNEPPILSLKDKVAIFHGVPRPYPWHFVQCSAPMATPTFGPSFPIQLYATAPPYWARPSLWNIPYAIPHNPGPGKHSRDEDIQSDSENGTDKLKESDPEKCLWASRTLRINDPGEASSSSIWSSVCINKNRDDVYADVGIGGGHGLLKSLQRKSKDRDEKNRTDEKSSTVLQSNPAALLRSVSFQERS